MTKMKNGILTLFFSAALVLFCSGCFSAITWTKTGKIETHIEDIRAEYTKPKELTVHSTGWQERNYLPFDWAAMGHVPWEQHIVLPLDQMPDKQTGLFQDISIEVATHMKEWRFYKTKSGLWSMAKYQRDYTHPDDIPHLSEPYISDAGMWKWLIIPLEVRETKDGRKGKRQIHVKGYWAHQVKFSGDMTTQYMEGVGITIWRCCLMPVPIVLDVATFPIQAFIWFGFLYKGPCGGGLLTD